MAFRGDIKSLGLGDVFQNLLQNKQTGTLTVRAPDQRPVHLYFQDGVVRHFSPGTDTLAYLPALMRKRAGVTDEEIETALKKRGRGKQSLAQVMVKMGAVTDEKVAEAMGFHGEEGIYDLFGLSEAAFEFSDGPPDPEQFDADQRGVDLKLDTNKVLFEAARRQDEWTLIRRKILSPHEVFVVPRDKVDAVKGEEDRVLKDVAKLLDGTRTVADVIEATAHGSFAVQKVVVDLLGKGQARAVSVDELTDLAERARRRGDHGTCARFCRQALEQARNRLDLREKLAGALEALGEREPAASEWKLLASQAAEAADLDRAVSAWRHAIACLPRDTSAREGLLRFLLEKRGPDAALADGRDLALTYRELGLLEKARDTYRRLLDALPGNPELPRLLADTHVELGDVAGGARVLLTAARTRAEGGNVGDARVQLQALLRFAPEHAEAKALLTEIESGTLERKLSRRRGIKRRIVAVVVVVGVVGYGVYDTVARFQGEAASAVALGQAMKGLRMDAMKTCESAARRFPLTRAAALLRQQAVLYGGNLGVGGEIRDALRNGKASDAVKMARQAVSDVRTGAETDVAALATEAARLFKGVWAKGLAGEALTNALLLEAEGVGSPKAAYGGLVRLLVTEADAATAPGGAGLLGHVKANLDVWRGVMDAALVYRVLAARGVLRGKLELTPEMKSLKPLEEALAAWKAEAAALDTPGN